MAYNRERLHFDRSKFLLGTYCLAPYARTEAHIKDIADAGIDFICAAPYDKPLLDLCHRYGVGVFAQFLPSWWGGDGDNAGKMAQTVSVASYEEAAKNFTDHPAVYALDTGDEPSALDFPNYGELFKAAYRLFPNQMPYLNLYPNYASVCENTENQKVSQLGTRTYAEHIDRFVENVDCDYICYDYYIYAAGVSGAFENLRIVADKCRETRRDLWIVLQVNSSKPEEWISEDMLRYQAYTALAFGARSINWACWTAGWWHNEVLDENGNKTEQYAKLCAVNPEIKATGEALTAYENKSVHFIGFDGSPYLEKVSQAAENRVDLGAFGDVSSDGAVIAGHFIKDGGEALMLADATDPYGVNDAHYLVTLKCGGDVKAMCNGKAVAVKRDGDTYTVEIRSCGGVLVTVK